MKRMARLFTKTILIRLNTRVGETLEFRQDLKSIDAKEKSARCCRRFAHKVSRIKREWKARIMRPLRLIEDNANFEINWFSLADMCAQLLRSSRFPRKIKWFSHFSFTCLSDLDLQRHSTLQPCGNQHFLDSWQFAWLSEPLTLMKKKKLIGRENCCQSFKL